MRLRHKPRILVVEDDEANRAILSAYLDREGYRITQAASGAALDIALNQHCFDLVLLDLTLPDRDGLTILRNLRKTSETIGIILVTAKADTIDRVVGLELGADDYITKPYEQRELLARVKNLLRRVLMTPPTLTQRRDIYSFEGWTLDIPKRRLTNPDGHDIATTTGEYDLLTALVSNAPRVMSRDRLLESVANREWSPSDRSVDVLVGRLRKKLNDDPACPRLLITVRNAGYVFSDSVT